MEKYNQFVHVLLIEADFAGYNLHSIEVVQAGPRVFGINAVFKDGSTARVNDLGGVFGGDNFEGRKELLHRLMSLAVPGPKPDRYTDEELMDAMRAESARIEVEKSEPRLQARNKVVEEYLAEEAELEEAADKAEIPAEPLELLPAIKALRHEDDAHWTKGGLPNLNVLSEYTARKVTRKELAAEFPDLVRQVA